MGNRWFTKEHRRAIVSSPPTGPTPLVRHLTTTKGLVYVNASGSQTQLPLNGAPAATATAPKSTGKGSGSSNTVLIVVVIVAVLALLGGLAALMRRRRPTA